MKLPDWEEDNDEFYLRNFNLTREEFYKYNDDFEYKWVNASGFMADFYAVEPLGHYKDIELKHHRNLHKQHEANNEYNQQILARNKIFKKSLVLADRRTQDIQKLIELRHQNISRPIQRKMLFLIANFYHASFVQENRIYTFNKNFKDPFEYIELEKILLAVNTNPYYKYSNKKLIEILKITELEEKELVTIKYVTRRQKEQNQAEQNKIERKKRNFKIKRMYRNGQSIKTISTKLNLSIRTIQRIVKK